MFYGMLAVNDIYIYIYIYVTRSGKRYHFGKKFEIALSVSCESAQRQKYDDANPAFVGRSHDVL